MTITRFTPNTVFLGGDPGQQVNDLACSETITPGQLVERANNAGVVRWKKHATAGGATVPAFATEHAMANKGPDDNYSTNDLVEVRIGQAGSMFWAFIASGVTANAGTKLESAGDGTLRALASGVQIATALENKGAVNALTRIRVETV
jgi:hypothetical protein